MGDFSYATPARSEPATIFAAQKVAGIAPTNRGSSACLKNEQANFSARRYAKSIFHELTEEAIADNPATATIKIESAQKPAMIT